MPLHDWSRVDAGVFHHFHGAWIFRLADALNGGILPDDFYALAEQRAAKVIPELVQRADAGAVARLKRRTITIRHKSGDHVVALVEIDSPANKDRAASVSEFVEKCVAALAAGRHLLVVDVHPPGKHSPRTIHDSIWEAYSLSDPYEPPAGRDRVMASYSGEPGSAAYVQPLGIGETLAEMPLFLEDDWYVNAPLESTYMEAWRGFPGRWRDVVDESTNA